MQQAWIYGQPRQLINRQMAVALPGPAVAVAPIQASKSPVSFQTILASLHRPKKLNEKTRHSLADPIVTRRPVARLRATQYPLNRKRGTKEEIIKIKDLP